MSFIPFKDFDPNNIIASSEMWGVYAGDAFKVYTKRAHALSRFAHWTEAKIYQYNTVAGRWDEIGVSDASLKNHTCDLCGGDTRSGSQHFGNHGKFCWDRKGSKLAEPLNLLFTCSDCRTARGL